MASKSNDNNIPLIAEIDDAKHAMSDIELHMKTLAGYYRELTALSDQGETENTKKKFEELKANTRFHLD